jgi:hypothetical protein
VRLCISPKFVEWANSLRWEASRCACWCLNSKLTREELRRLHEPMHDLMTDQLEPIGAAAADCDVIVGANAHQYERRRWPLRQGSGCVTASYAPSRFPRRTSRRCLARPSTRLGPQALRRSGETPPKTETSVRLSASTGRGTELSLRLRQNPPMRRHRPRSHEIVRLLAHTSQISLSLLSQCQRFQNYH